jgi:outer membrane protein TolC
MRRELTLGLVLGLIGGWAAAGEPISLAEALRRAREDSREVAAANARREAAAARVSQAKGFRLPSVTLEESWIDTDSPAEAFALTMNQERFSFNDFVMGDPNDPDRMSTAITRLEIMLPIYTGGEIGGRVDQATLAADAAAKQAEWAGHQAALAAAEAFALLDQAKEFAALLERARETVRAHVDLARAYADQGMLVRSELLRAEVELARVDDMLTEARGNVRVAEANLAFRLNADQGAVFAPEPLPAPAPLGEGMDTFLATADARADLAAARLLLRAGELEEKVKRSGYMPKVGVVARGDLVDDVLFGAHGESVTIMARASINLLAGGSDKAAAAAARWEAKAGQEDVARFAEGVGLETRQAYEAAVTARARHATATKALDAAREAERITSERFKTGVVKMIDVLDVTTARREAETRELVARVDAHTAALRLAVKAGRAPEAALQ